MGARMEVSLIFKIAAVGILVTLLGQILKHSGREEQAFLVSLAGLILVLTWIVPYIYDLFVTIQKLFQEASDIFHEGIQKDIPLVIHECRNII